VSAALERADVLAMLATYGNREPAQVPEDIDSLELAWLVHQIEQRLGRPLDVEDADLARMSTVSAVVEILRGRT
jgi:acyl carrier protein